MSMVLINTFYQPIFYSNIKYQNMGRISMLQIYLVRYTSENRLKHSKQTMFDEKTR